VGRNLGYAHGKCMLCRHVLDPR